MADSKTVKVGFQWDDPHEQANIIEGWRLDGWEVEDVKDLPAAEMGYTITLRRIEEGR